MRNERIWAFLIHLGSNMWAKKGTTWGRKIHEEDFGYKDEMYCDKEVWKKVVDFLPSQGFNTLLIDIGEGLQLDSHPEISTKGAWTKEELRAEIARLREMGITCLPKFNFSCRHNAWMGEWAYSRGRRFGHPRQGSHQGSGVQHRAVQPEFGCQPHAGGGWRGRRGVHQRRQGR